MWWRFNSSIITVQDTFSKSPKIFVSFHLNTFIPLLLPLSEAVLKVLCYECWAVAAALMSRVASKWSVTFYCHWHIGERARRQMVLYLVNTVDKDMPSCFCLTDWCKCLISDRWMDWGYSSVAQNLPGKHKAVRLIHDKRGLGMWPSVKIGGSIHSMG